METPDSLKNPFAFKLTLTEADRVRHEARMSAERLEATRLELEYGRMVEKAAAHRLEGIRLEAASTPTIGQACLRAAAITASLAGTFLVVSVIANAVLPSPKE